MARLRVGAEERVVGREGLAGFLGAAKVLPPDSPVSAYVNWVGNRIVGASSAPCPSLGTFFAVVDDLNGF